ncbi:Adenylate cyclase [Operophtera brumata]|uniref:Adenylate cyclase n=1 Tax=Operophtera brumata TaxID=104452 RepID=A0A0L7KYA7_OPEBR|nr:Adenylate cyclase [Operophtera brumata]
MTESALDLRELEKLRPNSDPTQDKNCGKEPEKWQMLLEPALVGSMLAICMFMTSAQNFYLRTACTVDLKLDPSICDKGVGEEFEAAEARSQALLSNVNISRSFIGSLISTVVLLFAGPWSDCSGRRKPLLILPLVGMSAMSISVLLLLTFPGASTVQALYAIQIPMSLGGTFGLLLAAAFSHIGDVAQVLGAVSGPLTYRWLGFYGVFSIVLFLQLSSLIYVVFYVKDVNINTENKVSVFNWRLPFNAVQCLVRRRDGNKRAIILLMLVVCLADRVILNADVYYSYMYYRLKFHFDDILFGSFLAYKNILSFVGTLLILTVLKHRLRLSDEIVGVLSGKIYSVLGALESAMQTITTPLYSLLYSKTVDTVPDAWLFPGLALSVLQLLAFLFTRFITKRRNLDAKDNAEIDKNNEHLPTKEIKNDSNSQLSPEIVDKKSLNAIPMRNSVTYTLSCLRYGIVGERENL